MGRERRRTQGWRPTILKRRRITNNQRCPEFPKKEEERKEREERRKNKSKNYLLSVSLHIQHHHSTILLFPHEGKESLSLSSLSPKLNNQFSRYKASFLHPLPPVMTHPLSITTTRRPQHGDVSAFFPSRQALVEERRHQLSAPSSSSP